MVDVIKELAKIATDLDADGFTKEADAIDAVIEKWAAGAMGYVQKNNRNQFRGIIRYADERGRIAFYPDRPVVGKSEEDVKNKLNSFGRPWEYSGLEMLDEWRPTAVFPFDAAGNRIALN